MPEPPVDSLVPPLYRSPSGQSVTTISTYQTAHSTLQDSDIQTLKGAPIVAVMGPTGAGKSTFVKIATGAGHVQIGDTLASCTQKIQIAQCRNPSQNSDILFIDTPGFDDTLRSDAEILEEIASWLQETYKVGIKLSGILYLHRITDNRVSNTLLRNLVLFQKLCGGDVLSNVTLVTTHWDQLQDVQEGVRNEEQLRNDYWKPFLKGGSQTLRFEHTFASAWKIINSLPLIQMPLEIQREMVDRGKPLADTAAGQSLVGWFVSVTKALRKFIRRLERLVKKGKSSAIGGDAEGANLQKALSEAKANLKEVKEQQSRVSDPKAYVQSNKTIRSRLSRRFSSLRVNSGSGSVDSISPKVSRNALHVSTSNPSPNKVPILAPPQHPPPAPGNDGGPTKVDENLQRHLCGLVSEIAQNKNSRMAFCGALSNGEGARVRAQAAADYLNAILRNAGTLKENDRPNVLRLFCELAKSAEVYPRCYVLEGIYMDAHPFCPGGFADVHKGKYEGEMVCCKVLRLPGNNSRHASILRTFAKEIVLWAHLSHKNILPFYGVYALGDSIQRISLVSPWMRNGNLRQYLQNFPDTRRVPLVQDVVEGLVHLHESKIVHGDLKAENILVSDDGRALITDFGLSFIAMSVATGSGQSPTGGTTSWMAPELLSGATSPTKPTKESDIWSFGCVCYEIFTGRHPFHHCGLPAQVVLALAQGEVPHRPEPGDNLVCAEFEDWTWEMMLGCWKKHTQDRYTGKAVRDLLKLKGMSGRRVESSYLKPGEASALQKAMKAQSDIVVDYQLVESILEEFLSTFREEVQN